MTTLVCIKDENCKNPPRHETVEGLVCSEHFTPETGPVAFNACKTFCATRAAERETLGDRVTEWLRAHPKATVVDKVVTQSSDNAFHALTITLFVRLAMLLLVFGFTGCGDVEAIGVDAAGGSMAGSMAGTGGTGSPGGAGGGTGGSTAGAAGAPACIENTRQDCRNAGEALLTAQYTCRDEGYNETTWGTCSADGKIITTDYYAGLPCPFDVGIVHTPGWTGSCSGCVEDTIITNGGGSTSAVWRNTPDTIYCCDAVTVRKIARCK